MKVTNLNMPDTETPSSEIDHPSIVDLTNMPSMDDLMGDDESKSYAEGAVVNGVVVEKRDSGAIVDIGYKAEGFIPKEELATQGYGQRKFRPPINR